MKEQWNGRCRLRRQKEADVWELSQERQFMENLVSNRFNFFIVFFGVILVYAFSTADMDSRCVILCVGSTFSLFIAVTVHRAQVKLTYILRILHRCRRHPVRRIGRLTSHRPYGSFPATWLIGSVIPFFATGILLVLAVVTVVSVSGRIPWYLYALAIPFLLVLGRIGENCPSYDE
jgi:hypothetical protein